MSAVFPFQGSQVLSIRACSPSINFPVLSREPIFLTHYRYLWSTASCIFVSSTSVDRRFESETLPEICKYHKYLPFPTQNLRILLDYKLRQIRKHHHQRWQKHNGEAVLGLPQTAIALTTDTTTHETEETKNTADLEVLIAIPIDMSEREDELLNPTTATGSADVTETLTVVESEIERERGIRNPGMATMLR